MAELTQSVVHLIEQISKLPGIGRKSAERIAYFLLREPAETAFQLADAIRAVKENVRHCRRCFNLAEGELCEICCDPSRKTNVICVVEQPRDLIAIENTGVYHGLYHVLLGHLAPLEHVGPEDLTIRQLIQRVQDEPIEEIIMATNPTTEGDGTALYISNQLSQFPVKVTRLARGVTPGSVIEFANKEILTDALEGRQQF